MNRTASPCNRVGEMSDAQLISNDERSGHLELFTALGPGI